MAAFPKKLSDLRNIEKGKTIWVVGSGPSLETMRPEDFDDKIVVTINTAAVQYGIKNPIIASNYSRHEPIIQGIFDERPDLLIVTPDHDICIPFGSQTHPTLRNNVTFRPHHPVWKPAESWPTDPDVLVSAGNGCGIAMHLAAYMGCSTMRLIGVDMGYVNGKHCFTGYDNKGQVPAFDGARPQMYAVASRLRADYGCEILRLVGSEWERFE